MSEEEINRIYKRVTIELGERNKISLILQIFVVLFILFTLLFIPQAIYHMRMLELLG